MGRQEITGNQGSQQARGCLRVRCSPYTRVVMIGASSQLTCGVRDQARVLAEALELQGTAVEILWWERDDSWNLVRTYRELISWTTRLYSRVQREPPDYILWHYSGFSWAHRGIPLFTMVAARRIAQAGRPVVLHGHELVYPWGIRGWRGAILAVSQRLVLFPLVHISAAVVVTTDNVMEWLVSRWWLPRRSVTMVPVFSNLPSANGRKPGTSTDNLFPSFGIFGYGSVSFLPEPVVDGIALLRERGIESCLVMIGAPGEDSGPGQSWKATAVQAGCDRNLRFTGILEPHAVIQELQAVDVVIFPDWPGPMSRRSTLAAALALGAPVVAFDGPYRWETLIAEGAVALAYPNASSLAEVLERLLKDVDLRLEQGERGLAFYREKMDPCVAAVRFIDFLTLKSQSEGKK